MKILVINGPNINMLGVREKGIYGSDSFEKLKENILKKGKDLKIEIVLFQSNCEGEIISEIHQGYYDKIDGIVINPGAYTHSSIAILDAIKSVSVNIPTIEVHISNIHNREEFRKKSITAEGCIGQISGLGTYGYELAIDGIIRYLEHDK